MCFNLNLSLIWCIPLLRKKSPVLFLNINNSNNNDNNNNNNNNLIAQQTIEGKAMPTDCWPHVHLFAELNDYPASLGVMCFQHIESLCSFSFIDRNNCYISVSSYQNSSRCWVSTDSIQWKKMVENSSPIGNQTGAEKTIVEYNLEGINNVGI